MSKLNHVLQEAVKGAENILKCIIIFDLSEGMAVFHNQQLKQDDPSLYQALFNDDYNTVTMKGLQDLGTIKKALNEIGEEINYGGLKFSLFRLEKGNMMIHFLEKEIPLAICFIAAPEGNIGSLQLLSKANMPKIERALTEDLGI